jgi:outer membrane protein assembly factor BamD
MSMRFRLSHAVALLTALLVLSACSGNNRLRYSSAQEAYEKGMTEFEDEDYDTAVRFFRAVFQYGRGNEYAEDAQFRLAEARERQGRYLLAASEYERFAQLYRSSQRVPVAQFRQANMYFKSSPQYQLDQSDSRRAISLYQLFIERHPQHELVAQAREDIGILRDKLAHKKYDAAKLYERRNMYEAAAQTYVSLFDTYPETNWADEALHGAVRAYVDFADNSVRLKQEERYQKAVDNYQRLAQLFPDSPRTRQAQSLYSRAQSQIDALRKEDAERSLAESNTSGSDDS